MGTVVFICHTLRLALAFAAAITIAALCVYVFGKTVGAF